MKDFEFKFPTIVYYETGELETLKILSGKKVLFLYGKNSLKENGYYDLILKRLKEYNIRFFELGDIFKADIKKVEEGIKISKKNDIEAILGVGGSTVMDLAKIISFGALNDNLWSYLNHTLDPTGLDSLYTVLIPTYPAGGSEIDNAAEVDDFLNKRHGSLYGIYPDVCIMNPKLTYSLDLEATSYLAIEQFVQASCAIIGTTGIVNELGITVCKNILSSLKALRSNLQCEEARTNLLLTSSINVSGLISNGGSEIGYLIYSLESIGENLLEMSYRDALIVYFPLFLRLLSKHYYYEVLKYFKDIFGIDDIEIGIKRIYELYDMYNLNGYYNSFGELQNDTVILNNLDAVEPFTLEELLETYKSGFTTK